MRYVSLFAGIGGFDLALDKLGHECVYANDIDKYCKQIYDKRFKIELDGRSIKDVPTSEIPDHDLLVGGFPCQAFSIAGRRAGFNDTRGTLFFDVARILKDKRPRYLVLENVKGLLSHDSGKTFQTILTVLSDLGYGVQWQVLNSKNHGVAQNRERILIVGHLRGESRPEVFPIRKSDRDAVQGNSQRQNPISDTITTRYAGRNGRGTHIAIGTYRTHKDGHGFRAMKSGVAPTIPARAREDGSGQPIIAIPVLTPDRAKKGQNGRRVKENGDPSFTLTSTDKHGIWDGVKFRRLTPLECERLQAFPDNWTQGVSDTQRYKMIGNAVTVNVIEAVASKLT